VTEPGGVTTPQPTTLRARATLHTRGIIGAAADPCPPPLPLSAGRIDKEAKMFEPFEMPEPEPPDSDDDDVVIVEDDALN
jgi:hypothetical protein